MSKIQSFIERAKVTKDPVKCSEFWTEIKTLKAEDASQSEFLDLICACLSNFCLDIMRSASTVCKLIKWRSYQEGVLRILDQLMERPDTSEMESRDSYSLSSAYDCLKDVLETMKNASKTMQASEKLATKWCKLIIQSLKDSHKWFATILYDCSDDNTDTWTLVQPSMKEEFLSNFAKVIQAHPDNDWYYSNSMSGIASWTFSKLLKSLKGDNAHKNCWNLVLQLYQVVIKTDLVDDRDSSTIFGQIMFHLMYNLLYMKIVHEKLTSEYYNAFLPVILEWHNKPDESITKYEKENYKTRCDEIVTYLFTNNPNMLPETEADRQCQHYFETKDYNTLTAIVSAYEKGNDNTKQSVSKHCSKFISCFSEASFSETTGLSSLLKFFFAANPKLITDTTIDLIESSMEKDQYVCTSACTLLTFFAEKRPELFKNRGDKYFEKVRPFNNEYGGISVMCVMLLKQIATADEATADRVVSMLDSEVKLMSYNKYVFPTVVSYEYQIAQQYPQIFRKRLPLLEEYKKRDTQVTSSAQAIIDIVEGRSLEKVTKDVEHHDKDIKNLGQDIKQTKNDVVKLDKRVDLHDVDIKANTEKIGENKQNLDHLGKRVDVAEDKIEDIDNKTVSNAPAWSKEVSKLLNPKANNDYTLVAQRLNYSSSDIRGWATQPDPTMSLLAEFYTTNKTSDATKYLIKILTDVNRLDVVDVIRKHEKNAENVVKDDTVYLAPPSVFISYQWGVQKNINMLKDCIEKEGYSCWMDLGQMGGGDMLYDKINEGIRSAKIVILCMTDLYTKSANCIREVNLANGLDKLIVPLVLEKELQWPPPGSMGPILAGKLFIRFFQRDNERTNDERYWPPDKYNELMDKIRGAVGNQVKVQQPVVATVAVQPPAAIPQRRNSAPTKDNKSCQVCISCSPDKETEMRQLQKDLTAAGYKTKLCSYVEDSVADFTADVYICCLCLRYSKSSMATKEIETILDVAKKPLITINLDKTEYPPSGPMKTYFSQSSHYINCSKTYPSSGSDEFQELKRKIDMLLSGGTNTKSKIPRSDSSGSLARKKADPISAVNRAKVEEPARRVSDVGRVRRGQEYNNFFKNNAPQRKRPNVNDEDQTYKNPDGPKLPSVYRQRLSSQY